MSHHQTTISWWQRYQALPAKSRHDFLAKHPKFARALLLGPHDPRAWWFWAEPWQVIPWDDDWLTLLLHSGRGGGKTLTASHAVDQAVHDQGVRRIILSNVSFDHVVSININGPDGIMATSRTKPEFGKNQYGRPNIRWPNGAVCELAYASQPTSFRSHTAELIVADELAFYPHLGTGSTRDPMTAFEPSLRSGDARLLIASTPNMEDVNAQRELVRLRGDPDTLTRQVATRMNPHLSKRRLRKLEERWKGTTRGRQELNGEIIIDEGLVLWTDELLAEARAVQRPDVYSMVVISIDPARKSQDGNDPTGIVVGGVHTGGVYVEHAEDGRYSPRALFERIVELKGKYNATHLLVEDNATGDYFGAAMSGFGDHGLWPVDVTADRSKRSRALDALAAYQQGKVGHADTPGVRSLEEQQVLFTGVPSTQVGHDDMVDADTQLVNQYAVLGVLPNFWEIQT